MTKRQEAKRVELQARFTEQGYMTVANLIELLKTYPQGAPVTGYQGQEETDLVTPKGVRLMDDETTAYHLSVFHDNANARVRGPFLDIMGF
jgi:hypothetical protein